MQEGSRIFAQSEYKPKLTRGEEEIKTEEKLAGWVARTRPLTGPLSPRGPQPVLSTVRKGAARANGPAEPADRVRGSWYDTHTQLAGVT
jgi:hypothetical protein